MNRAEVQFCHANDTSADKLDSGMVVIHTSNSFAAKPNAFKKVVMNFYILHSVLGQISECRSILK